MVILAASSLLAPTLHAQLCAAPENASSAPVMSAGESPALAPFGFAAFPEGTQSHLAAPLPSPRRGAPQVLTTGTVVATVNAPARQTLSTTALIELATESVPQTSQATSSEELAEPTLIAAADFSSPQTLAHVRTGE